ncbi:MAG: hypothetical protein A2Z99_03525 [Treponema sp. GWB1_62_6]|nr:MAG: hypothetical protein A2Z99_03525 [Treponema sp. GWB1_62_6]OHE67400.1 MAG: hypothetical protein A2001_07275 [Treponema sp. GWC1_61_84]OHE74711.1 MAG: hypothetical protein A2413_13065 [Treponema sp. RIFOXYC1_FULL_61_9]HCM27494.1 hypothetical protein [Treponema sp.]
MKKLIIAVLSIYCVASAWADHDYIFLGDERASLPGPNLPGSFYDDNPASTADSVFNALSVGFGFYPGSLSSAGSDSNGKGTNFVLSISNFRLVQISGQALVYDMGSDVPSSVLKDMLALQFGLSSVDLGLDLPVEIAAGVQLNRLTRILAEDEVNGTESGVQEAGLDLGVIFSSGIVKISGRAINLFLHKLGGDEAATAGMDLEGGLSGKLLLDIGYELKVSSAMAYDFVDFSVSGQLNRNFFSNSLQTGVLLKTFIDSDSRERSLPIYQYGMAVSYTVPGLKPPAKLLNPVSATVAGTFSGLVINGRASIQVCNLAGLEATVPVITFGVAKTF